MTIWVLAADSSRARVFQTEKLKNDLVEITALTNPLARLKEGDIVSDKPGSQKDSFGSGCHSGSPKNTAKEVAEKIFAKKVATSLDKAFKHQNFQQLYVIAAPKFLGKLRTNFSEGIKGLIQGEFGYDVSALKPEKISGFLEKHS